jgi:hypothetical protein
MQSMSTSRGGDSYSRSLLLSLSSKREKGETWNEVGRDREEETERGGRNKPEQILALCIPKAPRGPGEFRARLLLPQADVGLQPPPTPSPLPAAAAFFFPLLGFEPGAMLPSTLHLCTTCLEETGEKLDRGGQIEIEEGGSELGIFF